MKPLGVFRWLVLAFLIIVGATLCQEARGAERLTADTVTLAAVQADLATVKAGMSSMARGQEDLLREIRENYMRGPVYRTDLAAHAAAQEAAMRSLDARLTVQEMWRYALGVAFMLLSGIMAWVLKNVYVVIKQDKV